MRKILFLLPILLLALAGSARAQCTYTSVSGTIVDANGVPYSFANVSADLVPAPPGSPTCTGGVVFAGHVGPIQTTSTGAFTMILPANGSITPSSTQWQFTVQETGVPLPFGTGPQAFKSSITISGSTQSVSGTLSAAAPALTLAFGGSGGAVSSVFGRTGAVVAANNDYTIGQIGGLGTGIATFLGTPSSANLAAAVTGETGSGALVFGTNPSLAGTPTAPTASPGTNTTQIATTAFVLANLGSDAVNGANLTTAGPGNFSNSTGVGGINALNPSSNLVTFSLASLDATPGNKVATITETSPAAGDVVTYNVSGVKVNGTLGIKPVSVSSTPVVIATTNRGNEFDLVSGAVNLTIAQAGSAGFGSNFYAIIWNQSAAGAVTLTPATSVISGGSTNVSAAASAVINVGDICWLFSDNNNYFMPCAPNPTNSVGAITRTVASGSSAMGTGAISSASCATAVTATATGVATTDTVTAGFNGDPTAVTGYIPSTSGMLTIVAYPTSGNVNFKVCNNTAGSITPGAITLNWKVVR